MQRCTHTKPTTIRNRKGPYWAHLIKLLVCDQALEVAGQVAGASVSTSPLSYSTIAGQCEALGTGTRKKLSSWLTHDSKMDKLLLTLPADSESAAGVRQKVELWTMLVLLPCQSLNYLNQLINDPCLNSLMCLVQVNYDEPGQGGFFTSEPWLALKLPPASPFDNFLKAAGCWDLLLQQLWFLVLFVVIGRSYWA